MVLPVFFPDFEPWDLFSPSRYAAIFHLGVPLVLFEEAKTSKFGSAIALNGDTELSACPLLSQRCSHCCAHWAARLLVASRKRSSFPGDAIALKGDSDVSSRPLALTNM